MDLFWNRDRDFRYGLFDLTQWGRLLNADAVTSARVGQLAPPSEQQGEPLP